MVATCATWAGLGLGAGGVCGADVVATGATAIGGAAGSVVTTDGAVATGGGVTSGGEASGVVVAGALADPAGASLPFIAKEMPRTPRASTTTAAPPTIMSGPLLLARTLGGASNVRDIVAPVVGPMALRAWVPPYCGCGVCPKIGFGVP